MSTSFRTIFAGLAFAGLMAASYACSDTNGGSSRTGTGGDTSSGAGGAGTGTTGTTSSGTTSSGTTTSGSTTSGAGGGATTTSTGSAGGTTSTTTGMGGTGSGTGGAGGSGSNMACGSNGQPYTGPLLGRCSPMSCTDRNCGTSIGKGGFITLDDFETLAPTAPVTTGTINMTWASYDGRNGGWHQYSDPAAMASMILAPAGGGGSPDSVQAMHYIGGRGSNGATLALTLGGAMASNEAGCYDASAYDGISFWIKGN